MSKFFNKLLVSQIISAEDGTRTEPFLMRLDEFIADVREKDFAHGTEDLVSAFLKSYLLVLCVVDELEEQQETEDFFKEKISKFPLLTIESLLNLAPENFNE